MATEKTDVVIVGVGAAGGILAAELGKAGMKVIGLERGPRLTTQDFNPHDELRYFQRQDLRPNPKRQPVTWRRNADVRATPIPTQSYGNQAGGGTVHYGAVSWRLHEDDFRARSQTIERYGASAIPADSSLVDWPLSYAELEPYYDRAEYELGVSGKAGNLQGSKISGGNVRSAAPSRIPAAAVARGSVRRRLRRRRAQARLSSVSDSACNPVGSIWRPARLHLLRLLPGIRLPCRREVVDPRHQAARG
jgi:gluconate 2-dehydrogenase alpha chain